jgi:predicted RNA-binding protein (virulence factor B family)
MSIAGGQEMATTQKPKITVKPFTFQRVRTVTGSGVRLLFGPYTFVLISNDGTPERMLDHDGVKRILEAVYVFPQPSPVKPEKGNSPRDN